MKRLLLGFLTVILLAGSWRVAADEVLPVLKVGDVTYTNILVTKVTATDVFFTHARGMGNARLKNLSPEMQKHFNFDPPKAQAVELKQAENKAKYHEQLLKQPAGKAPDMSRPAAEPGRSATIWQNDFPAALKRAKSEGKLVLLNFTGSDWCPACMQMEREVLSTPAFAAYAEKNLQLVKVDFPRRTALPEEQKRVNMALLEAFKVEAYPTFILVNGDGRRVAHLVGGVDGGPSAFIAILDQYIRR